MFLLSLFDTANVTWTHFQHDAWPRFVGPGYRASQWKFWLNLLSSWDEIWDFTFLKPIRDVRVGCKLCSAHQCSC